MHPITKDVLVMAVVVLVIALRFLPVLLPWWRARAAGLSIDFMTLFLMRLRRIDPNVIVRACIETRKAGMEIPLKSFEALYLAQGHVAAVTTALVAAKQVGIALDFDRACAIDLAGRDVEAAVQGAIHPRDVAVPAGPAVAGDGVAVAVSASATLRICLERLVGGATEATVVARIGHAVVEEVAKLADHRAVVDDRPGLAARVFARDLTRDCGFTIDRLVITGVAVGGPVAGGAF